MSKLWNYLFFLQWRLLNSLAVKIIQKPIIQILSVIPFFRKNLKKGKKDLEKFTSDSKSGMNLGFAFSHMFITTTVIYGIFCLYITLLINYEIRDDTKYFLIGVMLLSYLTNYLLIWRKDIYLNYFREFEKQPFSRWHYLYIIFFHLGVWTLGILSVHWTVGFNVSWNF